VGAHQYARSTQVAGTGGGAVAEGGWVVLEHDGGGVARGTGGAKKHDRGSEEEQPKVNMNTRRCMLIGRFKNRVTTTPLFNGR
jgi:hypothetical protein